MNNESCSCFDREFSSLHIIKYANNRLAHLAQLKQGEASEAPQYDLEKMNREQEFLESIISYMQIKNIDLEVAPDDEINEYVEDLRTEYEKLIKQYSLSQDRISFIKSRMMHCEQEIKRIEVWSLGRS